VIGDRSIDHNATSKIFDRDKMMSASFVLSVLALVAMTTNLLRVHCWTGSFPRKGGTTLTNQFPVVSKLTTSARARVFSVGNAAMHRTVLAVATEASSPTSSTLSQVSDKINNDFGSALPAVIPPAWQRIGLKRAEDLALGVDPNEVLNYIGTYVVRSQ
jgi:hypothetical protein